MAGLTGQTSPGSAPKTGRSDKLRVAYIGLAGVVLAAVISGVSLYLSQRGHDSKPTTATSNTKVTVNVAPAVNPPAEPAFKPFDAPVYNLPSGRCAFVFSEPKLLQEDSLGCVYAPTVVAIYCTVESQPVGNSTVWDEIYYRTDWGTTGFIPDYFVYTGTNNAVMPSCVS